MNLIDLILTVLILIAFVRGYRNGLIKEILSLLTIFLSLLIALYFSDFIKNLLIEKFQYQSNFIDIVSFVITFLLAFFGIKIATKIFDKIADILFLGWLNNILGGVFSSLKFILILSFLIMFFEKININQILVKKEALNEIQLYEPIKNANQLIFPWVESWIKNYESEKNTEIEANK
jgi:membrane protein required for colicin V production